MNEEKPWFLFFFEAGLLLYLNFNLQAIEFYL